MIFRYAQFGYSKCSNTQPRFSFTRPIVPISSQPTHKLSLAPHPSHVPSQLPLLASNPSPFPAHLSHPPRLPQSHTHTPLLLSNLKLPSPIRCILLKQLCAGKQATVSLLADPGPSSAAHLSYDQWDIRARCVDGGRERSGDVGETGWRERSGEVGETVWRDQLRGGAIPRVGHHVWVLSGGGCVVVCRVFVCRRCSSSSNCVTGE